MTPEVISALLMGGYLAGLVFIQRTAPFLPLLPIQIVCGPYFVISTLTNGWSNSSLKVTLLFAISLFVVTLSRKLKLILTKPLIALLGIILLPLIYALFLAAIYTNKLEFVFMEIVPVIEFVFFLLWTYFYLASHKDSEKLVENIVPNFFFLSACSAITTISFFLLFPEYILFGVVDSGGDGVTRLTDFFAPIAVLIVAGYMLRSPKLIGLFRRLVYLSIFGAAIVVSLLGMYRSIWFALASALLLIAFKARKLMLFMFYGIVLSMTIFLIMPGEVSEIITERLVGSSIAKNPRTEQAIPLLKRLADKPWGSGVGATIFFTDKTDATKDGPGQFVSEERPYKGNYYLSWIYFAGPTVIPFLFFISLMIFKQGVSRKTDVNMFLSPIILYFSIVLVSFPAVLHYPILAVVGILLGIMAKMSLRWS